MKSEYLNTKEKHLTRVIPLTGLKKIFTIDKIQYTNPITYKIKDLNNEEIKGPFYEPELLKAEQNIFRIEKVITKDNKKKQALVKWKGYNNNLNSWIPMKDLQSI